MDLRSRLDYFRKEHDEILHFLNDWKNALKMAGGDGDDERRKGLAELRRFENELLSIQEHCHAEERTVDSPFQIYLDDVSLTRLAQEHELLRQLSNDFLRELRFATLMRTNEVVRLGNALLEQLRRHIAHEAALLEQIEEGRAAEEKLLLRYTDSAG